MTFCGEEGHGPGRNRSDLEIFGDDLDSVVNCGSFSRTPYH